MFTNMTKLFLTFIFSLSLSASTYKILDDPIDSLSARVALIMKAEQNIYISKYIFKKDQIGMTTLAFLRLKKRKAQLENSPIDIKLLLDGFGSSGLPIEVLIHLEEEGIEIKFYNDLYNKKNLGKMIFKGRFFYRMHDKFQISDSKWVISGGRNIENSYYDLGSINFLDRDVLASDEVAQDVSKHFLSFWNNNKTSTQVNLGLGTRAKCLSKYGHLSLKQCLKKLRKVGSEILDNHLKDFRNLAKKKDIDLNFYQKEIENLDSNKKVRFFSDSLDIKGNYKNTLSKELVKLAMKAKKKILIETAYFVPTENFMKIIDEKLKNNVQVTLITNSVHSSDMPIAYAAFHKYKKDLLKLGYEKNRIKIYEYQGKVVNSPYAQYLHAKSAVIDDSVSIIGSYNLDKLSKNFNSEVAIVSYEPEDALILGESIRNHIKYSYRLGDDGYICQPNECQYVNDQFIGGSRLFPHASYKQIRKINRSLKLLSSKFTKKKGVGPWLERRI